MSLLKEPINRSVYDFIIKSPHVESLFDRYGVLYIVTSLQEQTLSWLLFLLLFSVFAYLLYSGARFFLVLPVIVVVLLE